MTIRVYRVKLEGYVTYTDFGKGPTLGGISQSLPDITPADWGPEEIVKAIGADIQITETLVDTIEDEPEQPVSMEPLETAIDILQRSQSQDNLPTAQNDVRLALEGLYRYHSEVYQRETGESQVSGG